MIAKGIKKIEEKSLIILIFKSHAKKINFRGYLEIIKLLGCFSSYR